jgi:hypothetical protein
LKKKEKQKKKGQTKQKSHRAFLEARSRGNLVSSKHNQRVQFRNHSLQFKNKLKKSEKKKRKKNKQKTKEKRNGKACSFFLSHSFFRSHGLKAS